MKQLARRLASNRLTIAGFVLLAAGVIAAGEVPQYASGAIAAPLALLAANLAAAIVLRPSLRRGGLGLFHAMLLALLLLAGWGRLTHFDARVEVTEGSVLEAAQVQVQGQGPWHGTRWRAIAFRQGTWEVDYAPGVRRGDTRSQAWLSGEHAPRVVGDDTPLVLDGYRFYTTHNKGFAPVLTWQPEGGDAIQGALHMPSYPLFDYQQENRWTAPDGRQLRFWLRIEQPLAASAAWTLSPRGTAALLVMEVDGQRRELRPGEAAALPGAVLRYERLAGWMGYKIFYDPTLLPMLAVSLIGVLGLGWHLWGRGWRWVRLRERAAA